MGTEVTAVSFKDTGEIRGTARLNERPPRRRASRYSGRTQAAKPPQTIPTFFFFKQKTAYEISEWDWNSDVCSSDLRQHVGHTDREDRLPIADRALDFAFD